MNWFRIFDLHTAVVTVLTLVATFACMRFGVRADLPFELIAIAVVFPTAFSISAAHRRREEALAALASLRSHIASLYYAHRDWVRGDPAHAQRASALGARLYAAVCAALACRPELRSMTRAQVSEAFSDVSLSIEALRAAGIPGSETSRANQFLNLAIRDFERLRTIADYRTSDSMRAYSKVFLNLFPVLFAPFYAHVAVEGGHALFGYGVALAFALVLVGLDNVQDGLENPFDGWGADDVRLNDHADLFWLGRPADDERQQSAAGAGDTERDDP